MLKTEVTPKGIVVIHLDEENRVIFGESSSTPTHYKWLVINAVTIEKVALAKSKNKETRDFYENKDKQSEIVDFALTKIPNEIKASEFGKYIKGLRAFLGKYVTEDGAFPKNMLSQMITDAETFNLILTEPKVSVDKPVRKPRKTKEAPIAETVTDAPKTTTPVEGVTEEVKPKRKYVRKTAEEKVAIEAEKEAKRKAREEKKAATEAKKKK